MTKMIDLLAIDQGSTKCGYAHLIDGTVTRSGVFNLKGKDRMQRYKQLLDLLIELITDENIKYLAIEDVFQKRTGFNNPKTSKIMGETRGIIAAAGLLYGLEISNINPAELTKFLHINTRVIDKKTATKEYVAELLQKDVLEDEADAVLIGIIANEHIRNASKT